MNNIKMPQVLSRGFAFNGGLDQVTPPLELGNGMLRTASNVEIAINGGYKTLQGYERFSGKPKPSSAVYAILTTNITGTLVVGNVLTDNAGTSFGTVLAITATYVVLSKLTGTFTTGNVRVGGVIVGTCTGGQMSGAAPTSRLDATYINLAADLYRADIAVVPGSGNVLGVWQYAGKVYAFRNNAGATAAVMHVQSASGWTPIALGRDMPFTSGGTYEILEGNVITGATSGATATITRVCLTSGSWAAGTAAGTLVFASQTGNFVAENLNVGANLNVATIAANSTAITLSTNGAYEFANWNFGGQAGTRRMYGCDGVNRGFEFDGTVYVPIRTGMTADAPTHLRIHKNQLFFSFAGSAQHSGIATPYAFAPIFGASELACGDDIEGFLELPGSETSGAMAIYTQNRTLVLYGNDVGDWNLVPYSEESGGLADSIQYISQGVCLDSQGVKLLATTQRYGNFQDSVISDNIAPFLDDLINTVSASCIVRKKNMYRLFFSGGNGLYITFKKEKVMGMTTVILPNPVLCMCSMEGSSGLEEIYFGSSDGFVYQMDIGTSFDGDPIEWRAELAFNNFGGPRTLKSFRMVSTEVTGSGYSEFMQSSTIGYGSTEYDSASTSTQVSALAGVAWDSFIWDTFFWDGRSLVPSEAELSGTAENLSLLYYGSSDEFNSITLNSAIVHYSPRRLMRYSGG
jgi:hypothetical protein